MHTYKDNIRQRLIDAHYHLEHQPLNVLARFLHIIHMKRLKKVALQLVEDGILMEVPGANVNSVFTLTEYGHTLVDVDNPIHKSTHAPRMIRIHIIKKIAYQQQLTESILRILQSEPMRFRSIHQLEDTLQHHMKTSICSRVLCSMLYHLLENEHIVQCGPLYGILHKKMGGV